MNAVKVRLVRWTADEKEKVIAKADQLIRDGHVTGWTSSLFEAQNLLLPHERRRPRASIQTNAVEYRKMVSGIRAKQKEMEDKKPAIPDVITPEEPKIETKVLPLESMLIGVADQFANAFKELLTARLIAVANEAIADAEEEFKRRIALARESITKRKMKVVVVGTLPAQAVEIENDFSHFFKLTFVRADEKMDILKDNANHADFVILMADKISHSHQNSVRTHKGLLIVHGGVTAIKDKLTALTYK